MNPKELRDKVESGDFNTHTSGICPGYAQGNLVILPKAYAYDFLVFAYRNKKACPILDISNPGEKSVKSIGGSNIYKAIPKYRVYKDGVLAEEIDDADQYFDEDLVAFVIGCSFTFEAELVKEGISMRHMDEGRNVAMYDTNIELDGSGPFKGHMVVSMRPFKRELVDRVIEITSRFPDVHGAPVHVGDPKEIGILNIDAPDYGDSVAIESDEVPVFWACGVTPQNALKASKIPFAITHAPGHMLVMDILNEDLKV